MMAAGQNTSFKGRHFTSEVILWALRRYLAFPISYRDLAAMLSDRGVLVDHTTLFRWVQAYAPKLEQPVRRHLSPCTGSTRRTSRSRGPGPTCTERSTPSAGPLISCSPFGETLRR